ncbi:GYDIA family GHMP kinase [Chryseobacterium sp. MP_3.2]|uniref:GYDIA family GHMP kinase n=1 Tax=Chryseobacterium sp. MP_3.2 TaxID=3071712 RepID=UPI002DFE0053|nr:mevalonate kinase [Chryseobacterium sp. MP_3.2]
MKGKVFSPGKLLLTSEYVVLDGALALAVPTKWGQEFFYEEIIDGNSHIIWSAYHQNQLWLQIKIDYSTWEIIETNKAESADFILKILKNIQELSPSKFKNTHTYHLKTNLQFPSNFGLGSSSTLMNNLAAWAEIDAFTLNENNLGGSGYDIAVAQKKTALLYRNSENNRHIEVINYEPDFKQDLLFVHLNAKQNSREGIDLYRSKENSTSLVEEFSQITKQVVKCKTLAEFSALMEIHETKLSGFLGLKTVKEQCFSDCPVFVKSLGAWGGDFVMTAKFSGFESYFRDKGFSTFFSYDKIIS